LLLIKATMSRFPLFSLFVLQFDVTYLLWIESKALLTDLTDIFTKGC